MAGWLSDSETDDDEVLNLSLFLRKSFGFKGFSEEKENTLRKIVTHLGASCDDYPKYMFTTTEYFTSLTENNSHLYNVTYIRDCVDANRCLSIDQYRFGTKQVEKKDYRDFEPCCANFHNEQGACMICDPTVVLEIPNIKKKKKVTEQPENKAEIKSSTKNKKEPSTSNGDSINHSQSEEGQRKVWQHWESQELLDWVVNNNLFKWVKGHSLYKRVHADGVLLHRSESSMRTHFREKILKRLRLFNISESAIRKLRRVQNSSTTNRVYLPALKKQMKKKVLINKQNKQMSNGQLKNKKKSS